MTHSDLYPYLGTPLSSVSLLGRRIISAKHVSGVSVSEHDKWQIYLNILMSHSDLYPYLKTPLSSVSAQSILAGQEDKIWGKPAPNRINKLSPPGNPTCDFFQGQIFSSNIVFKYDFQMSSSNIIVKYSHEIKYPPELSLSSLNSCIIPFFGFTHCVSPLWSITHKPTLQSWKSLSNFLVRYPSQNPT